MLLIRIQDKLNKDILAGHHVVMLERQDAITIVKMLGYLGDLQNKIDDMAEFLRRLKEMPDRTTGLEPKINEEDENQDEQK